MNLSALNTGLNPGPVHNAPEPNGPGQAALRLPPGTLSGEDFAAFLRNQVNALKHNQRPEIAAAPMAKTLPLADRTAHAIDRDESVAANNQNFKAQAQGDKAQRQAQDKQDASAKAQQAKRLEKLNDDSVADQQANSAMQETGLTDADLSLHALDPLRMLEEQAATDLKSSEIAASSEGSTELTTIPLSPSINIITVAQTTPDEKSLSEFALAMGLDPDQILALFGPSDPSKALPNAVTTQQMLAMNGLPAVAAPSMPFEQQVNASKLPEQGFSNVAVSTADFQALKTEQPSKTNTSLGNAIKTVDILNMQVAAGPAAIAASATVQPISTLAVLSMMDTQLRPEDIDALKNEFDAFSTVDLGSSEHGLASGNQTGSNTHAAQAASKAAAFVNHPDMAQTFDKLSEKLATELAGRMHEKLNAGEWKMKFALKPASLGLVDVQLEMRDGKLTAQFNADTALTQDLIQSGSQRLKEALGQLGMNNASVLVGQGQSQQQGQASNSSNPSRQGDDNRVKLADESGVEPLVQAKPRHSNSLQFDNYA